jgi:chromosomal replication initiation ATPase DnaA
MKIEDIIKRGCEINGISQNELLSKERHSYLTDARKMIMAGIRINTSTSSNVIGKMLNRDHATVLHNVKKHYDFMDTDKNYREKYAKLKEYIEQVKGGFDPFMYRNSIMISLKNQGL